MILMPSPNYNDRPEGIEVKYLILHYTGMATGAEAVVRLCDPASNVSAHYVIEEDGRVFSLVAEEKRAWHAGVSAWQNDRDINSLSIGIELVNPGHDLPGYQGDYRSFPEAQMTALIKLSQEILSRHPISPFHILGHSDVAPSRKVDPGELFEWERLATHGIGYWPQQGQDKVWDVTTAQRKLKEYGYQVEVTGIMDRETQQTLSAFQRHFRPSDFSGKLDGETCAILESLITAKKAY